MVRSKPVTGRHDVHVRPSKDEWNPCSYIPLLFNFLLLRRCKQVSVTLYTAYPPPRTATTFVDREIPTSNRFYRPPVLCTVVQIDCPKTNRRNQKHSPSKPNLLPSMNQQTQAHIILVVISSQMQMQTLAQVDGKASLNECLMKHSHMSHHTWTHQPLPTFQESARISKSILQTT
jgi:hypothetical protein